MQLYRAVAVNWTRRPAEASMATHPGVCCLRTNVADWDDAALWRTCTTLTDLEAVFRSLKSERGLRPIHHRKPVRAEGHLFITVIACQAVQVIRRRRARQLDHAARRPRRPAARHRHLPPRRRARAVRAHRTVAEAAQKAIHDALGIDPHPGGTHRTVV